jgi:hypothetical protein
VGGRLLDTVLCNAEQQHTLHYCLLLFSCVDTLRTESCEACSLLSFKVGLLNRIHVCQSSKGSYWNASMLIYYYIASHLQVTFDWPGVESQASAI